MKKTLFTRAFTLIELLVVISIIAILAGIALPVFSSVTERGAQTKNLSNAKQIGLGCKLYATDFDGKYPNKTGNTAAPDVAGVGTTSNAVFASLIPNYIPTEKIFYLAKSAWSNSVPDEDIRTNPAKLQGDVNNFAYMFGLNDTSNPSYPLLFDAPQPAATTYVVDESALGGVWKGKKAVVIRCDQSGNVENCRFNAANTVSTIQGPTGGAGETDILVRNAANNWLGAANFILYPDTAVQR